MRLPGMCKQWLAGIRQQLEFGAVFDVAWAPKRWGVRFMQRELVTVVYAEVSPRWPRPGSSSKWVYEYSVGGE